MSATTSSPLTAYAALFDALPGDSIFITPADADRATAAFRALRIRPALIGDAHINAFGVWPPDRGVPAVVFAVTTAARWKLHDAGLIDRERIVCAGL